MKKVLIALLSICCLFFNVFTVSAHDNPDTGITPYTASIPCPNCGGVATWQSRLYHDVIGPYSRPCIHGVSEKDWFKDVCDTHHYVCGSCGYEEIADIISGATLFLGCGSY